MCSYLTVATDIAGSAKGPQGWFAVTSAQVYFDHPFHAPFDHTLNIDFADPARPRRPGRRRAQRGLGAASGRVDQRGACSGRGRRPVTTPDAPAAGVHLPWARVPAAVRSWAEGVGGGAPGTVRDVAGGFSPGATVVLQCPQRAIFVKAVGTALNPESPGLHRREVLVSAALPPSPRVPRFLDSYDDGDWVALAFEAVVGRPPRHPWETGELALVAEALSSLHRDLTPSPLPSLTPLTEYVRTMFGGWADLATMDTPPPGLDRWARRPPREAGRARVPLAGGVRGPHTPPR